MTLLVPEVSVQIPLEALPDPLSPSSLRLVERVADLVALFEPEINAVTLRRSLAPELVEEARQALVDPCFRRLFSVEVDASTQPRVRGLLPEFPRLAGDVAFWVELLAEVSGCERAGVRLARVDAAMCPRFHVDRVLLRIVCSYAGAGTELAPSEAVDRSRMGHAAGGLPDEASGLLRSPGCIQPTGPGDVVLLKGEAWPGNTGRGAVHRSPPASPLSPRLVLTLDPL